jgi:hypothetical protein
MTVAATGLSDVQLPLCMYELEFSRTHMLFSPGHRG